MLDGTAGRRGGGSPALQTTLLTAVPSSICRRRISREATSVTEFAQGDAVQRVRIARRASRLATTKARRRIPTKTTGVGPDPGTSVVANVAVFGRVATRTLREAVAEAAASLR